MLNNNIVGLIIWVVMTLYFNNLNPWVAYAETRVMALKGIMNANSMIIVCNNGVPLKIETNKLELLKMIINIPIENIIVIFNAE
tara:strand:+ start:345 stop:596 length:252 start_codon:yes stop_codon:yes gene_type:complete